MLTRRILLVVVAVAVASGCAVAPKPKPRLPGLYRSPYFEYRSWPIKGVVGLSFSASTLADCEGGPWSSSVAVETGQLPPGLSLKGGNITGVPTLAGDWHFAARFSNVICAGKSYPDVVHNIQVVTTGSSAP